MHTVNELECNKNHSFVKIVDYFPWKKSSYSKIKKYFSNKRKIPKDKLMGQKLQGPQNFKPMVS